MTAKKIVLSLLLLCVAFVVIFCIVVALQPNTFSVERSTTIAAPSAAVFAVVNDLAAWHEWSPWTKLDPNAKTTMSTPSAGRGATFTWDGNQEIGAGSLTILESQPDSRVDVEQAFIRPFAGKALMTFQLAPRESGTAVTWTMTGTNDFFGKALCLFMDMDKMLGKSFEQGLAGMKELAEKRAAEKGQAGREQAPAGEATP